MERMKRMISVLLMALIGCVTVFQCHHHDDAGHPFFMTYFNEEITEGLHCGDCHSHDCDDTRADSDPCGMHLSEMLSAKHGSEMCPDFTALSIDFLLPEHFADLSEKCITVNRIAAIAELCPVYDGQARAISRRGPPLV